MNDWSSKPWQDVVDTASKMLRSDGPVIKPSEDYDWSKPNEHKSNPPNFFSSNIQEPSPQLIDLKIGAGDFYACDGDSDVLVHDAVFIGQLVVHSSLSEWGGFQVSHEPTGVSFMKAVPEGKWSKEQLINWCKQVQQACRTQWDMLATLSSESYQNVNPQMQNAKNIIQRHCWGVKVQG